MNPPAEEGEEGENENILASIILWTVGKAALVTKQVWRSAIQTRMQVHT